MQREVGAGGTAVAATARMALRRAGGTAGWAAVGSSLQRALQSSRPAALADEPWRQAGPGACRSEAGPLGKRN